MELASTLVRIRDRRSKMCCFNALEDQLQLGSVGSDNNFSIVRLRDLLERVKLNGVVEVDRCTLELYAYVNACTNESKSDWCSFSLMKERRNYLLVFPLNLALFLKVVTRRGFELCFQEST